MDNKFEMAKTRGNSACQMVVAGLMHSGGNGESGRMVPASMCLVCTGLRVECTWGMSRWVNGAGT